MDVLICNLCFLLLIHTLFANMEGHKYNYDHLVHKYYHKINIFINNYVCNMFYTYVGRLLVIDVIVRPAVSVSGYHVYSLWLSCSRRLLYDIAFQYYFGFEDIWWRLFQKHVVCTNLMLTFSCIFWDVKVSH